MPDQISIFDVGIDLITKTDVLTAVQDSLAARRKLLVAHVHVKALNAAYAAPWLRDFYNQADLVYCDGNGVRLGAYLLGKPLPQRFTLADWMDDLMRVAVDARTRVFFLGSEPGVAAQAAEKLAASDPRLQIAGTHHGFFDRDPTGADNLRVVEQINASGADLLLVGMGVPHQERWLVDNRARLGTCVEMTVGGIFEYVAGVRSRAPRWLTDHGFEWLTLMLQYPTRFGPRHLFGNPLFLARVLGERISGISGPPDQGQAEG